MPTQTHSPPPWRTTLRLWPFTRPHAAWLGLGVVVAATEAGLNIAVTFLVRQMTDAALASQAHTFLHYLKWMMGAIGSGLVIAYVGRVAGIRLSDTRSPEPLDRPFAEPSRGGDRALPLW